ncbi:GNAT family N-acetyltransferase [Micromonospora endolithica]|uniref:GNAT family N-acetyltransferase n=1 Tax=Micromonospora endolithica TaxID=230091 RepID=A0A3A9ZB68_9ACTN|nr:GNAT family N-acetyltransferase [Micromonospora endolithica]RKN45528.1 GNAT family N-acetyltransferase [Micromonospora endolithica]TWJ22889.1 acetyltransferase (GNAT) family protein [Micromonospora endolithica]
MTDVTTRPLSPSEFDAWQDAVARGYADSQVAAGVWPADEALDRAVELNRTLLPHGLDTPGVLLLRGVRADGTPVGRLWISLTHPRGVSDCAFLFDIEVDAAFRGQGLGRALLGAAEAAVREHGITQLELNVFGDNAVAIGLYASAGYQVVTQQMRRRLT